MKKSGIYEIVCMINNGIYIGKTGSNYGFSHRWACERWMLRNNKGQVRGYINRHLQNAWNKYGEENFEFRITEECCDEVINQREKAWIKYYREAGRNVYNFSNGGEGNLGYRHTKETKKKMSESRIGHKAWNKGISPTKETRKKLSISKIGNKNCLGHKATKESKQKMSNSQKGLKKFPNGRIFSDSHKRNLKLAWIKRKSYV